MSFILKTLLVSFLDWLAKGASNLFEAYKWKRDIVAKHEKDKEALQNAQTEEERKRALDSITHNLP